MLQTEMEFQSQTGGTSSSFKVGKKKNMKEKEERRKEKEAGAKVITVCNLAFKHIEKAPDVRL